MASFQDLPAEIISTVVSCCDRQTLKNARLTYRQMEAIGTVFLFEQVWVYTNAQSLERLWCLASSQKLRGLVKELVYSMKMVYFRPAWFTEQVLVRDYDPESPEVRASFRAWESSGIGRGFNEHNRAMVRSYAQSLSQEERMSYYVSWCRAVQSQKDAFGNRLGRDNIIGIEPIQEIRCLGHTMKRCPNLTTLVLDSGLLDDVAEYSATAPGSDVSVILAEAGPLAVQTLVRPSAAGARRRNVATVGRTLLAVMADRKIREDDCDTQRLAIRGLRPIHMSWFQFLNEFEPVYRNVKEFDIQMHKWRDSGSYFQTGLIQFISSFRNVKRLSFVIRPQEDELSPILFEDFQGLDIDSMVDLTDVIRAVKLSGADLEHLVIGGGYIFEDFPQTLSDCTPNLKSLGLERLKLFKTSTRVEDHLRTLASSGDTSGASISTSGFNGGSWPVALSGLRKALTSLSNVSLIGPLFSDSVRDYELAGSDEIKFEALQYPFAGQMKWVGEASQLRRRIENDISQGRCTVKGGSFEGGKWPWQDEAYDERGSQKLKEGTEQAGRDICDNESSNDSGA